ncbi:beta-ketoacyl-ACP synthase III [Janibacter endophyticus]|jgi:3-oxoacyl-[acyl-carrier-protein] synthase-3|uniref:beta-ketoacyl-ACP synthase III n=1 Tax=Janibacter endophyticus TaxID=2806261 RepID=UPI001F3A073D|nr:beta-ketoacyl-ACP synthase III [Janibacter endophyticus]
MSMVTLSPGLGTVAGGYHSRISGVGGYRPERVVPNSEIVERIDSTDEWIRQRSGIQARHRAAPEESVVDMSVHAARAAIEHAGLEVDAIDAIIVATVTHPYQTPAAAPEVAHRLGLTCMALDISAACAGYCHGIGMASDMVRSGSARHVLVLGVEKLSDFTDYDDRSIAFIFGDGAGAAVVSRADSPGISPTVWGSDGEQRDVIAQVDSWIDVRDDAGLDFPTIKMQGQSVFRWAVWTIAKKAQETLDAAGLTVHDIDAFVPHQANLRIIDSLAKTLGLPEDVVIAKDIVTTANTSAASVPLAMSRMVEEGQLRSGDVVLQIAFGAGLAYAGQVVVMP